MLQKLSIRNYALIDSLDIVFERGLNIITGETGAGKSIILGALSLILGQRAESKYFFNQEKKCIIEGTFALQDDALKTLFEENDLDFYPENLVRREISIDGKSRAFINDTPVNLSILKQIGEKLIDIHSQQATQELNDPAFQLLMVDALANHKQLLADYRSGYKKLRQLTSRLNKLISEANEAKSKQDYEQFQFDELAQANLKIGEQKELEQILEKLSHVEAIKKGLFAASEMLDGTDQSTLNLLKESASQLQNIEKFDPNIASLAERLRSATIEIKDVVDEINNIGDNTAYHPDQLEITTQRLDVFYSLQQKHRVINNEALLEIQAQLQQNLDQLLSFDEDVESHRKEIDQLKNQLSAQANQLSSNRKAAVKIVEAQTASTLKQVGMQNAALKIELNALNEFGKDGLDNINLLFSANAGQPLAPVNKVASGGELSRLMLAIKALLAQHTSLPTIIFDEIDTGISGETALKVGEVIAQLGENMQVISITHLPQIAAKGHSHFFVHKTEEKDKTTTSIRKLSESDRVNVIAEMLSGKNPGASALQNAKELLG
ncbi:DNA repair protein RecN (Recombination protein N) [Pedobacter sp. UYP30]|uniref:DNA repair protein RecN n=1 Tax=Pedobacter sp. UYP30 TaxID=1756400 RepID=UPI00339546C1